MSAVAVQLSVTPVGTPVFVGNFESLQLIVLSVGQVKLGLVSSLIKIFCKQVDVLPHLSVAVQVRLMVPVPLQPVNAPLSST